MSSHLESKIVENDPKESKLYKFARGLLCDILLSFLLMIIGGYISVFIGSFVEGNTIDKSGQAPEVSVIRHENGSTNAPVDESSSQKKLQPSNEGYRKYLHPSFFIALCISLIYLWRLKHRSVRNHDLWKQENSRSYTSSLVEKQRDELRKERGIAKKQQEKQSENMKRELEKERADLAKAHKKELARFGTCTPSEALDKYSASYVTAKSNTFEILKKGESLLDNELESIESAIRLNMFSVLSVLIRHRYDTSSSKDDPRYASNIMLYVDVREIEKLKKERKDDHFAFLKKKMKRFQEVSTLDGLEGVLITDKDLSMNITNSSESVTDEIDSDLSVSVIPIPKEQGVDEDNPKVNRKFPGETKAFFDSSDMIPDTHLVHQLAKESYELNFAPTIYEANHNYYTNDKSGMLIRSLLSLSINGPGNTGEVIGVINIHRDSPNILESDEMRIQFQKLIAPIIQDISVLLHYRATLKPIGNVLRKICNEETRKGEREIQEVVSEMG